MKLSTYIKYIQIVINEVFYDFDLMLSFSISLKQAGSKQQGQVLSAHLIQISTLLYPKREKETACKSCYNYKNRHLNQN